MAGRQEPNGTKSIGRALDVLQIIASGAPTGLQLKDISQQAGLTGPTAHRILLILEQRGLLERRGRHYVVGRELTLLGLSSELRHFRELASPTLSMLSEKIEDAIFLSVSSQLDTVCADRKIGRYPIQVLSIEIGSRRPLGISVNGIAILSRMPQWRVETILDRNAERLAPYKTSRTVLLERVALARKQGYAHVSQAIVRGSSAIGVPILDAGGRPIAAVSSIAISSRQRKPRVPFLVELLSEAADVIAEAVARDRTILQSAFWRDTDDITPSPAGKPGLQLTAG